FLAYEFDGNGPVTGTPVVSTMSSNHLPRFGTINMSADLTQMVTISSASGAGAAIVRLLNFDASTGQANDRLAWNLPQGGGTGDAGYSADFSPSGQYVYATKI